jgi:hypothetical protein
MVLLAAGPDDELADPLGPVAATGRVLGANRS